MFSLFSFIVLKMYIFYILSSINYISASHFDSMQNDQFLFDCNQKPIENDTIVLKDQFSKVQNRVSEIIQKFKKINNTYKNFLKSCTNNSFLEECSLFSQKADEFISDLSYIIDIANEINVYAIDINSQILEIYKFSIEKSRTVTKNIVKESEDLKNCLKSENDQFTHEFREKNTEICNEPGVWAEKSQVLIKIIDGIIQTANDTKKDLIKNINDYDEIIEQI
ncbi:hypothetical protein EDEG_02413, partial [Edhazardia aedis USNM 41457]